MGNATIVSIKVLIALSLAGSLLVQFVILPLLWTDLTESTSTPLGVRISLIAIGAAGVLTLQVFAVCVWRLLTLVRTGTVFSPAAFRYVDVIIGAIGAACVLTFLLAVVLAPGGIAPGVVGLVCGGSLVLAGMTLLVVVMRRLLVQAVDRDMEARLLRSELDEVV